MELAELIEVEIAGVERVLEIWRQQAQQQATGPRGEQVLRLIAAYEKQLDELHKAKTLFSL
jgi:hypothetical protein